MASNGANIDNTSNPQNNLENVPHLLSGATKGSVSIHTDLSNVTSKSTSTDLKRKAFESPDNQNQLKRGLAVSNLAESHSMQDSSSQYFTISDLLVGTLTNPEFLSELIPQLAQAITETLKDQIAKTIESTITAQITPIVNNLHKKFNEFDACQNTVKQQQTEIRVLNKRVNELESQLEDQEQYSRRNCLLFHNIPASDLKDSTADDVVVGICNKIGVAVSVNDISRSHPLGPPRNGKVSVVARFLSYRKRALVFSSKKKLKGNENKTYISEHLTKYRAGLTKELAIMRKDNLIETYWTQDGNIKVKISPQDEMKKIQNMSDILELKSTVASRKAVLTGQVHRTGSITQNILQNHSGQLASAYVQPPTSQLETIEVEM